MILLLVDTEIANITLFADQSPAAYEIRIFLLLLSGVTLHFSHKIENFTSSQAPGVMLISGQISEMLF